MTIVMRIISGTAKGKRLYPPHSHQIRPVSDKVKEAIFNTIYPVEDKNVLDLFAGTGSVGLEALSRGAHKVVFVDAAVESLKLLKKNIEVCKLQQQSFIFRGQLPFCLHKLSKKEKRFDFIFVDPPYDKDLVNPTLEAIAFNNLIDASSLIIIEHSPREKLENSEFVLLDQRQYGQTIISYLKIKG